MRGIKSDPQHQKAVKMKKAFLTTRSPAWTADGEDEDDHSEESCELKGDFIPDGGERVTPFENQPGIKHSSLSQQEINLGQFQGLLRITGKNPSIMKR